MYLASRGNSKMSGFNAQILLRGPQAFLQPGEVCHVSCAWHWCYILDFGASVTETNLCFPKGIYNILHLNRITTCMFPPSPGQLVCCIAAATLN